MNIKSFGQFLFENPETDAPYSEHITSLNCKTSRGLQLEYIYPSINPVRDCVKIESANVELIGETKKNNLVNIPIFC
jgi:hypothetical protein